MGRGIASTWAGHASTYSAARWSGGRRAGKTSRPLPSPRRRVSVRERYSGRRRQRLAGTSPAARTTRGGVPAGEAPDRRAALAVPEAGRSVGGAGAAGGGRWRRAGGAPAPALRLRLAGISPPLQCLDRGARGRKRRGRRQPLEACRRRAGAPLPFSVGGAQGRSWCVARAWRLGRPAASRHFPRGAYDAPDAGRGSGRRSPRSPRALAMPKASRRGEGAGAADGGSGQRADAATRRHVPAAVQGLAPQR